MNRKVLGILLAATVILVAGITIGVIFLFNNKDKDTTEVSIEKFIDSHRMIKAVPSDAAIVLCVKNFGRACEYLGDSCAVFGQIFSGKFKRLVEEEYSGKMKKSPAIISTHFSKDLQPLLVIEAPEAIADSTEDLSRIMAAADSSGLFTRINGEHILISSSETIINSSVRHYSEGHSILEASGFSELAGRTRGEDVMFLSNAYSESILAANFSAKHRKLSRFFTKESSWIAFSIMSHSDKGVSLHGQIEYGDGPSFYLKVLEESGQGDVRVAEVLPPCTSFVISLPTGDISSYLKAYRNYLDSKNELNAYKASLSSVGKGKPNPEEWAEALNIKELAIAQTLMGEKLHKILLIRPGKKQASSSGVKGFEYSGYAGTLFGGLFSCGQEEAYATIGNWLAVGDSSAIEEYSKPEYLHETLKERLSENGLSHRLPQKDCRLYMFHSLGEAPGVIEETFSPAMAKACRKVVKDVSFVPVTMWATAKEEGICLEFNLDRAEIFKSKAPLAEKDTTVDVPSGPFKVKNFHTQKTNTFYQNSHLSICLQDENGKDMWGVRFNEKICGHVEEVDYFNNGKLQYLFAAGSKLYLIDRLGRFVNGFPVEIGKRIVLGPAVHDFSGTGSYTAVMLHKDNTIGMYSLQGKKTNSWKGITADETIKSLPELLESQGDRYWIVRTSIQTLIYPFDGGTAIVRGEGDRMIRPESKISINEKGQVVAKCYDGKDRVFKLEQK